MIYRARQEDLLLLTADKDFGELVFRQSRHVAGIILMRISGLSARLKSEMFVSAVRDYGSNLMDAFMVITPGMIRIRHINQPEHET